MALTDIEVRKAKVLEKAYRLSGGGGKYLWITPSIHTRPSTAIARLGSCDE